jgi:hypothetical protein
VAADHSVAIRKVTVIAVDLPGIGDSSIPADNKADMITAANQIHDEQQGGLAKRSFPCAA